MRGDLLKLGIEEVLKKRKNRDRGIKMKKYKSRNKKEEKQKKEFKG